MAPFCFNIGKGRVVELYRIVDTNIVAASALVAVPLSATDTEANRQDDDNLSVFLAAAPNEQTTSWTRKTWTDTELAAFPAPDDTNNRYAVQVPQTTWTGPTGGNNTTGLVIVYDADTAAGADTDLVVLTHHDFVVTADGNDVILNVGDFFRAS